MIEVKDISKSFRGNKVLNHVSCRFEQGKTNLVIGQSGSGKTVLMKAMVGLLEIDEGDIEYGGRSYTNMSGKEKRKIRQEIGMLFQGGALFDFMSVEENIMFPLSMFTKESYEEKLKRVDFCLDRVNLAGNNKLMPSELSGGMVKRVAIARAISLSPKYLFCDEPNSGLDPKTAEVIDELISEITHDLDITTIVNTHDMNSVLKIGEIVSFIHKGELWWTGNRSDVLSTTNEELGDFIFSTELTRRLKR
jgi:phospholipid/cholesterol/gamma-HCH transport system ATP-binding protein